MIQHKRLSLADTHLPCRAPGWLSVLGAQIRVGAATCADYYTAAARYEQLSSLCDAELARRRLSRATLAWDLCQACDRTNG